MKRFCSTVAVALIAFACLSCNDYNNSVQYATGSTLLNISPTGVVFGGPSFTLTLTASPENNGFRQASDHGAMERAEPRDHLRQRHLGNGTRARQSNR